MRFQRHSRNFLAHSGNFHKKNGISRGFKDDPEDFKVFKRCSREFYVFITFRSVPEVFKRFWG